VYARVLPVTALHLSKAWKVLSVKGAPGSRAVSAAVRGASATYSFTGRSVALIANTSPASGRVRIVVDGRQVAITSLASARAHTALVVWTSPALTLGRHVVTVVSMSAAPVSLAGVAQVELGSHPAA
jgi:hypothetical protein